MPSPKRSRPTSLSLPTRRSHGRLGAKEDDDVRVRRSGALGFLCGGLTVFLITLFYSALRDSARSSAARLRLDEDVPLQSSRDADIDASESSSSGGAPYHLFIAIGSAPANYELRAAARASWLKWAADDARVSYRFFSDSTPDLRDRDSDDLVLMDGISTGYGTPEKNVYGVRALYQLRYALSINITHFLRVDDDSFLCLHRLLYELQSLPAVQFFWGKYWCSSARFRADENYMLFSADVGRFILQNHKQKILPYDTDVTFGWNFGYYAWILNLTIFDDQKRLDAQQSYLTSFMHANATHTNAHTDNEYAGFCDRFIFAHHVQPAIIRHTFEKTNTHTFYSLPRISKPEEYCPADTQSFTPARHSSKLPNIILSRPAA